MGRIAQYQNDRLPLGEILEAFPEEITEIVPKQTIRLKRELSTCEEAKTMRIYYAMSAGLPGWFAKKLGEEEIPKELTRILRESRWLMDAINNNTKEELPVAQVKAIPITRLHDFVELKKRGNKYSASCPFHKDKTPSFLINENNLFYCFSCHAKGDAIEFYKKLHNVSFPDAVKAMKAYL